MSNQVRVWWVKGLTPDQIRRRLPDCDLRTMHLEQATTVSLGYLAAHRWGWSDVPRHRVTTLYGPNATVDDLTTNDISIDEIINL